MMSCRAGRTPAAVKAIASFSTPVWEYHRRIDAETVQAMLIAFAHRREIIVDNVVPQAPAALAGDAPKRSYKT